MTPKQYADQVWHASLNCKEIMLAATNDCEMQMASAAMYILMALSYKCEKNNLEDAETMIINAKHHANEALLRVRFQKSLKAS